LLRRGSDQPASLLMLNHLTMTPSLQQSWQWILVLMHGHISICGWSTYGRTMASLASRSPSRHRSALPRHSPCWSAGWRVPAGWC